MPESIKGVVLGIRVLDSWVLGTSGFYSWQAVCRARNRVAARQAAVKIQLSPKWAIRSPP